MLFVTRQLLEVTSLVWAVALARPQHEFFFQAQRPDLITCLSYEVSASLVQSMTTLGAQPNLEFL